MAVDIYESRDLPREAPLFVFVHGGYWQEGSREINTFMVEPLVEAGCRVALIGYDLCPQVSLAQLYAEVQVALLKLLRSSGASSVVLCGHSAGACTVLWLLARDRWGQLPNTHLLRTVILLGGIYDLTEAITTQEINRGNLLGIRDEAVAINLSPLHKDFSHLYSVRLRVCVMIAQNDAPGLVEQGHQMHQKLRRQGVHVELVGVKSLDHFDLVTELRRRDSPLCVKLLEVCGLGKKSNI